MAAKIAGWLAYFAVLAALIFVGWNQPLHYRFISQAAIYAIEHPATPPPAATPKPGGWLNESTPANKPGGAAVSGERGIFRPQGTP